MILDYNLIMETRLQKQIDYWRKSAEKNLQAAKVLFDNQHYDSCLFFCHLALEKMIKGLVVITTGKEAPYIHDLEKLARLSNLSLDKIKISQLQTISTFNIAGRYVGDKYAFYKQCTSEYTKQHLAISKSLFIWLKKEYQKK